MNNCLYKHYRYSLRFSGAIICLAMAFIANSNVGLAQSNDSKSRKVSQQLVALNGEFIDILNSQNISNLGALIRPDLTKEQAVDIYVKQSPGLITNTPAVPLTGHAKYVLQEIAEINSNVAFAKYERFQGRSTQYAMWIRKQKLWYLSGFGWSRSNAVKEALKYGDYSTINGIIK